MTPPAQIRPAFQTFDAERAAVENAQEHDSLAEMIGNVSDRVEAHDTLLGRDGQALRQLVQDAVAQAIAQTASDPKLWAAIRAAMVSQTKEAAGGWLLDGISSIGTKLFWAAVIVTGLYLVGGWQLVVKAAKSVAGQ